MKLKYDFVIREVGGVPVAVSTEKAPDAFYGMVRLNATGKVIFEMLQKGAAPQEIVAALIEKYGVSTEQATQDADAFIRQLADGGLIEE